MENVSSTVRSRKDLCGGAQGRRHPWVAWLRRHHSRNFDRLLTTPQKCTWHKLLRHSEPQFPHLESTGDDNHVRLIELFWG